MRSLAAAVTLGTMVLGAAPSRGPLFVPGPGSPLALGKAPNGIVAADLDGDGRPDIVTTNGRSHDLSVLLGDGRGGFLPAPGVSPSLPVAPHLAAAGDLDGDRRLDLVVTAHDSFDVFVWLGDGRGGFRPARGSPVRALDGERPHNHGLALGDLDRDGNLDVVTTDDGAHAVAALLGDGKGGLSRAPGSPFHVGREPYPLAQGDVNSDDRLDVVTPCVGSDSLSVLLGDGRGGFASAPGSPVAVAPRPYFAALGDVDGDGSPDAVVSHDDAQIVTVLLGDGAGGFTPAPGSPLDVGRRLWELALEDVDGDGRLDLLGAGGAVLVLHGDGAGRFRPAPGSPYPSGRGSWTLAIADFDLDGKRDVATADLEDGTVTVLLAR